MTVTVYTGVLATFVLAQAITPQCGTSGSGAGSGSTTPALPINTQSIVVDAGPANNYYNGAFTSVTLCVSGTSTCQTIADMLVDTGSSGIRVLASVLTLSLPQSSVGTGPLAECNQFLDSVTWGAVRTADVKLAGEQANAVPIQVIGGAGFETPPKNGCGSSTMPPEQTVADLGANGVLGIGSFRQDCGQACAVTGSSNPGLYYACPSSGCQTVAVPLTQQLQNPVWMFSSDNNGVVIQLPSVPLGGLPSVTGQLIFGIGTQPNNALGTAQAFTLDPNGNFATVFNGRSYSNSFIDSGSNGVYFLDSATTGLPDCKTNSGYYCPTTVQNLSGTQRGLNGTSGTVGFKVGNADQLLAIASDSVYAEVAGDSAGTFDWGLPFFFGRTVFTSIEGQSAPGATGIYVAY
jgi:hypothetical protein